MVEKTVLDYLLGRLEVPVCMERPEEKPQSYVIVEKTGSTHGDHLYHPTLAIQSYAPTLAETAKLNEAVKEAMLGITELNSVSSCKLNSDYNFTKAASKEYCYQAVFDMTYLGG